MNRSHPPCIPSSQEANRLEGAFPSDQIELAVLARAELSLLGELVAEPASASA